ncbi:MAG TPA: glucosyltransferase domain-containing protein [Casimicrobiaceae bacterium]|nr:glucosyltransferase domain-containing protein [Casimicrobiaceae bacterium]
MSFADTPVERLVAGWWGRIDAACKTGFFVAIVVNVLAFGFEMTNLTMHHDDLIHIFIQDTILGHFLGRPAFGWLHYYTQNHYIMPFLQMTEAIVLMSAYGVLVAYFWGARKAMDISLVAAFACVFPYMAQMYQYNTSQAPFALAHLLAAAAVIVSVRAKVRDVILAAILYVATFAIYQAVVANSATIFILWLLSRQLFGTDEQRVLSKGTLRSTVAVVAAVGIGGVAYMIGVSMMHIDFDSYQAAGDAFELRDTANLHLAIPAVWEGIRSFFLWPESYFPDYLKTVQIVILVVAGLCCLWVPKRLGDKVISAALLALACLTPRVLQLLHPEGHYHSLTLTSYALLFAGAVMIINRTGGTLLRNASVALASFLIAAYIVQCNWVSTVNYLNTMAHFDTVVQVLARVRSIPGTGWDGKKIAVVGAYEMPNDYPLKQYEAIAPRFMEAKHMDKMARLLRDQAEFVPADQTMPKVLQYAATHAPWPSPESVAVVDGMGVVVFSKPESASQPPR